MIPDQYHFLVIDLLIAAIPLSIAFKRNNRISSRWKGTFTAVAVSGAVFLAWEELFTRIGIWGFNEQYLLGIYIGLLPLEVYLFFFTVPLAFLLFYQALHTWVPRDLLGDVHPSITWFFLLCTVFLGVYFYPKIYTSVCFSVAALLLAAQMFVYKAAWLGRFYLAFFVALIPLLLLNGWLAGVFTEEPITWHNALETMGMTILDMPLENIVFLLAFLLLTAVIYERSVAPRK